MDPTPWIVGVTALGNLVKAWIDARKSGIDLQKAKLDIASKVVSPLQQPPAKPNGTYISRLALKPLA